MATSDGGTAPDHWHESVVPAVMPMASPGWTIGHRWIRAAVRPVCSLRPSPCRWPRGRSSDRSATCARPPRTNDHRSGSDGPPETLVPHAQERPNDRKESGQLPGERVSTDPVETAGESAGSYRHPVPPSTGSRLLDCDLSSMAANASAARIEISWKKSAST